MGPAGQELGTSEAQSKPKRLKAVNIDIGVITGNRSYNPFFSWLIPGRDDGKVSTESAKLAEMKDFLILPSSHAFIMRDSHAIKQAIHFLRNSKFSKEPG